MHFSGSQIMELEKQFNFMRFTVLIEEFQKFWTRSEIFENLKTLP